uniref:agamous-like MADS-box protein AGL21 n=1 Tax=Fragaria vesca subsp. vesca TaxID=101020 RepID=UPI0005CB6BC9|nr:PREDICTED: agamous-like MADS-box protein AGL21 [Fragaria vesca subsp. vesca]
MFSQIMGRSNTKLPLELIKNEKSRNVTFRKRKKGLMKKTFELNKLCDVQCSVIIYEKKPNGQLVRPETYPENPEEVKQIIDRFVSKSAKVRKVENLADYFGKQIMQVKKETAKLRQKNNETRFPSWDDRLNDLSLDQLLDLLKKLDHKIEDVHQRFDKQYAIDVGILSQTALFSNNNLEYSQMVALNEYPNSGSMMYISDRALPEEQSNLQVFQNNLINYPQSYNSGSIVMNRNGMPWQNYNIQSAPSASNGSNYDESITSLRFENRLQYGSMDDNLTLCNQVPLQTVYPMSASYLCDNANQFLHLKG